MSIGNLLPLLSNSLAAQLQLPVSQPSLFGINTLSPIFNAATRTPISWALTPNVSPLSLLPIRIEEIEKCINDFRQMTINQSSNILTTLGDTQIAVNQSHAMPCLPYCVDQPYTLNQPSTSATPFQINPTQITSTLANFESFGTIPSSNLGCPMRNASVDLASSSSETSFPLGSAFSNFGQFGLASRNGTAQSNSARSSHSSGSPFHAGLPQIAYSFETYTSPTSTKTGPLRKTKQGAQFSKHRKNPVLLCSQSPDWRHRFKDQQPDIIINSNVNKVGATKHERKHVARIMKNYLELKMAYHEYVAKINDMKGPELTSFFKTAFEALSSEENENKFEENWPKLISWFHRCLRHPDTIKEMRRRADGAYEFNDYARKKTAKDRNNMLTRVQKNLMLAVEEIMDGIDRQ